MSHPDALPDAYWNMLTLTVQSKQFEKTFLYLLEVEQRFRLQMDDLTTVPDYAEFVKTPEYQEWLKRPAATDE